MDTRTVQLGTVMSATFILVLTALGIRYRTPGALILGGIGLLLVLHGYLSYVYFQQQ